MGPTTNQETNAVESIIEEMMMQELFLVQKVKCDGCSSNIREGLLSLPGIDSVEVEVSTGQVTVQGTELSREQLAAKLNALGYPEA